MIVSHGRRYIFIHAPKTGGTSIATALEDRAMKDDVLVDFTEKAKRRKRRLKKIKTNGKLWKHSKLAHIYGLVTQGQMESFFVFMIVRNPWDRVVSYYYWLREQSFDHPAVTLSKLVSFPEFLRHPHVRLTSLHDGFSAYVRDQNGVDQCDLFIRLEHLREDIAPLEAHLGFTFDKLPHVNTSTRAKDFRTYFTDEDAAIVADSCADDIARFGYSFDG